MSSVLQLERAAGVDSTLGSVGEGLAPAVSSRLADSLAVALADRFSRKIVVSAVAVGKTINEISAEQGIPVSTCYRKVRRLVDTGVMLLERIVLTPAGSKYGVYRSTFSSVSIKLVNDGLSTDVTVNPDVADKLHDVWLATKWK